MQLIFAGTGKKRLSKAAIIQRLRMMGKLDGINFANEYDSDLHEFDIDDNLSEYVLEIYLKPTKVKPTPDSLYWYQQRIIGERHDKYKHFISSKTM